MTNRHIALVGFMGAGKSTVGPRLARALGRDFFDLDQELERQTGKTIAGMFTDLGEPAFRQREWALLETLLARRSPTVLALGGGTMMQPEAAHALRRRAYSVYLRTDLQVALARLQKSPGAMRVRPLLGGAPQEAQARAAALFAKRQATYETCDVSIDTTQLSPKSVCIAIAQLLHHAPVHKAADTRTVMVTASSRDYEVTLQWAADTHLAAKLQQQFPGSRVGIVTDANVAPLHAEAMLAALRHHGAQATLHVVPAGEGSKSWAQAGTLCEALLAEGFGRRDVLIAMGGGVVGDLTGFVASCFMRGIAYVQVPTTTLAAVDSSVGGKTAVNTQAGKNLLGTFYPPWSVFVYGANLATQSRRQHAAGLVESVKMAATHDAQLFARIAAGAAALLDFDPATNLDVIARSIAIKAGVVNRDERESGERAVLNVGHTIGHAIEAGEHYRLLHGEAVALGMLAEAAWAHKQGWCGPEVGATLAKTFLALNMPVDWQRATIAVQAMQLDKKRLGAGVIFPVVDTMGHFIVRRVSLAELTDFVSRTG